MKKGMTKVVSFCLVLMQVLTGLELRAENTKNDILFKDAAEVPTETSVEEDSDFILNANTEEAREINDSITNDTDVAGEAEVSDIEIQSIEPETFNPYLATVVNTVPQGIDWPESITEDTFSTPYERIEVLDSKGNTYFIEVVPNNLYYFIDSMDGRPSNEESTSSFDAIHELLGEQLLNDKYDQIKGELDSWGLINTDAGTKAKENIDIHDKSMTGIYGSKNQIGEQLEYEFFLPAGRYALVSEHVDWWSQNRPLRLKITSGEDVLAAGQINLSRSNNREISSLNFDVNADTTIKYTVESLSNQAPVISWIGISKIGELDDSIVYPEADFGIALEDNDQVLTREGASLKDDYQGQKMVFVSSGWIGGGNSAVTGGAVIKKADDFFKRPEFTLYVNLKFNDSHDNTSAILLGNSSDENIRLIPLKNDGLSVLNVNGTEYPLKVAMKKGIWQAVAVRYEEIHNLAFVSIYLNGEEVLPPVELPFLLSKQSGIVAGFGITFGTGFMRTGNYDQIVVTQENNVELAKKETLRRKEILEKQKAVDYSITLNGPDVEKASQNKNGLTFKGFGLINGNGTSNLLLDYKYEKPQQYWEMMQYLFGGEHPLFTHIKMELGNDGNNSTAAEPATVRYENEKADVSRSPGFVMAADAKRINPNVKISFLRWEMPNWVKEKWNNNIDYEGYEALYDWYRETVFDAYEKYGYIVDFINPDKNETSNPNSDFIKWFSKRVKSERDFPPFMTAEAKAKYQNIKIIASDENKSLNIVPMMRNDQNLYDSVDIIGFHYRTNATDDYIQMADVDDKEVWYSEGCATFGYTEQQENKTAEYGAHTIGGYQSPLALMDSFNNAFMASRRTHYIFQPAIGGFYEGIQYGHKELLSARDPWSGYIHYDPALSMLQHFSSFAHSGWENESNSSGIWRVIPNASQASFGGNSNEHQTAGINGEAGYITLASPDKKDFSIIATNNTQNEKMIRIQLKDMATEIETLHVWQTITGSYLQQLPDINKEEDAWYVKIPAYGMTTITTLDAQPINRPHSEVRNEDRTVLDVQHGESGQIMYKDDFSYTGYPSSYLSSRGYEPRYMVDTHGAFIVEDGQLKQELSESVSQWNGGEPSTIVGDFRWMDYKASISARLPRDKAWARLTIRSQTGMNWNQSGYTLSVNGLGEWELRRVNTVVLSGKVTENQGKQYALDLIGFDNIIIAKINNEVVGSYSDSNPMRSGRVKISCSWDQVYFDNLLIEKVDGGIPYALSMFDGQSDEVQYLGVWKIDNPGGGSADNWYRTLSISRDIGSEFSFELNGAGFALIGENSDAVLDIYVDGQLYREDFEVVKVPKRYETVVVDGLRKEEHDVRIVVKDGQFVLDAIYGLEERVPNNVDFLMTLVSELPTIELYQVGDVIEDLPLELEFITSLGKKVTKPVKWKYSDLENAKLFQENIIQGEVEDAMGPSGIKMQVSVLIKEVIPRNVVYYIDQVDKNPSIIETTPSYSNVQSLLGKQLLNQVYDQMYLGDETWGRIDTSAQNKGYDTTESKIATGLYGKENKPGEVIQYALTLGPGSYTLYSGHREWWNMNRPMITSLTINGEAVEAGKINLNGASGDIINRFSFDITEEQTVVYNVVSAGSEAPVISWLVVAEEVKPPLNTLYKPQGEDVKIVLGDEPNPSDHILNRTSLPNDTRYFYKETPDTSISGKVEVTIIVEYSDGSSDELIANLIIVDEAYNEDNTSQTSYIGKPTESSETAKTSVTDETEQSVSSESRPSDGQPSKDVVSETGDSFLYTFIGISLIGIAVLTILKRKRFIK
jgi:Rib/alpha/Esp surface antigen-like repeat protein